MSTLEKLEDYRRKASAVFRIARGSPVLVIGLSMAAGVAYILWKKNSKTLIIADCHSATSGHAGHSTPLGPKPSISDDATNELRKIAQRDEELSQAEFKKLMAEKKGTLKEELEKEPKEVEEIQSDQEEVPLYMRMIEWNTKVDEAVYLATEKENDESSGLETSIRSQVSEQNSQDSLFSGGSDFEVIENEDESDQLSVQSSVQQRHYEKN